MTVSSSFISVEEFRRQTAGLKPYYEYWFGKAVQKSVPTWLHSLLQIILGEFLARAGYISGSELQLRINPHWNPVPDVVGADEMEEPYPTKPVAVVIEILSPNDDMSQVEEKCQLYAQDGIQKIFVLSPVKQTGSEWNQSTRKLDLVRTLGLPNGREIDLAAVWDEMIRRSKGKLHHN